MAKREKKAKKEEGLPPWMVTFSDIMTLMLTFFVLLNSMAVLDETRKLEALGSIIGTFGMGQESLDVLATKDTALVEPGPMEDVGDLTPLREALWEDMRDDIRFASNKFVQVLSISSDVLFAPGTTEISPQGEQTLDRILPLLVGIDYPILLGGHTATLRDELGEDYFRLVRVERVFEPSWRISLYRTLAVYRYLLAGGMTSEQLRVEAFGRFRPLDTNETPEGRSLNRRVDLVIDRRSGEETAEAVREASQTVERESTTFDFEGFEFQLPRLEQDEGSF